MDTPFIMVRVTGLEPVRQRHTPLKRACLPIPAHSHIEQSNYSILFFVCQYEFLEIIKFFRYHQFSVYFNTGFRTGCKLTSFAYYDSMRCNLNQFFQIHYL